MTNLINGRPTVVYGIFDHVDYEGSQLISLHYNKDEAELECKRISDDKNKSYGISYRVEELEIK